jgi:hypothetical protein
MNLGPLVAGGDTVSILRLDYCRDYLVYSNTHGHMLTWTMTIGEAIAIGEKWLIGQLSGHEKLAVCAELARFAGKPAVPEPCAERDHRSRPPHAAKIFS